jgi:hypothetical protein
MSKLSLTQTFWSAPLRRVDPLRTAWSTAWSTAWCWTISGRSWTTWTGRQGAGEQGAGSREPVRRGPGPPVRRGPGPGPGPGPYVARAFGRGLCRRKVRLFAVGERPNLIALDALASQVAERLVLVLGAGRADVHQELSHGVDRHIGQAAGGSKAGAFNQ